MNKKTLIIIVVIVLVVVGYFGYKAYSGRMSRKLIAHPNPSGTKPAGNGPVVQTDAFPLSNGSRGDNVKGLQAAVNLVCSPAEKLQEDGVFGPMTGTQTDLCLADVKGHLKGSVNYAEYRYLSKKVDSSTTANSLLDFFYPGL